MDTSTLLLLAEASSTEMTLLKWAVILSGLAVVGVVWTVWNIHRLATNQVRIAAMLEGLIDAMKGRKD